MRNPDEIKLNNKINIQKLGIDGGCAIATLSGSKNYAAVIFSWN